MSGHTRTNPCGEAQGTGKGRFDITGNGRRRDFMKTPDGLGYYNFRNKRYNGFVVVLSYDKVKTDARKRNQILFDKLGLPSGNNNE